MELAATTGAPSAPSMAAPPWQTQGGVSTLDHGQRLSFSAVSDGVEAAAQRQVEVRARWREWEPATGRAVRRSEGLGAVRGPHRTGCPARRGSFPV